MNPLIGVAAGAAQARRERLNTKNARDTAEEQALLGSNQDAASMLLATEYLDKKHNGEKKHRILKWGGGLAVVAAGAILISTQIPACGNALKSLVPNVSTTTQQEVNTAISKISLKQDAIIATGEGTSKVDIRTNAAINWAFVHLGLPLSNEETGAQIKADLNIVSLAGAVTLQGIKGPNGQYETLATVNENMIEPQLADEKDVLTGGQQFIPNVGDAFGVPSDMAQREGTALAMAQTTFEAACTPVLTQVLGNAEGAYIHSIINLAAEDTTFSSTTHDILTGLDANPVLVQIVDQSTTSTEAYSTDFVSPSDVHISLPTETKGGSYNNGTYNIDVSGESCMLTQTSADELEAIKNGTGSKILSQPMDLPKPPYNAALNQAKRAQ